LKNKISKIREIVWPLLDPLTLEEKRKQKEPIIIPDVNIDEENLDSALDLSISIYTEVEDRRKGIESKAALLLSTISIASSIIVTASTYIAEAGNENKGIRISIFISSVVAIYAARTVWYSVRALERGNYHQIGVAEINISGSKVTFKKCLIKGYWEASILNGPVINKKVDFLVLAQEYYKRAIIVIFIYALALLGISFLPHTIFEKKQNPKSINNVDTLNRKKKLTDSIIIPMKRVKPTYDTLSANK